VWYSVRTPQRMLVALMLRKVRLSLTCQSRFPCDTRVLMLLNMALNRALLFRRLQRPSRVRHAPVRVTASPARYLPRIPFLPPTRLDVPPCSVSNTYDKSRRLAKGVLSAVEQRRSVYVTLELLSKRCSAVQWGTRVPRKAYVRQALIARLDMRK
jgi:hypothetical protein